MSLRINGTLIGSPNYRINKINSDAETLYDVQTFKPARSDGEVVINVSRAMKSIQLIIIAKGNCAEAVEESVDNLKEIADLDGDPIVVSYAGGYRLFYCNTESIKVSPIHQENSGYRTVTINLTIADPPLGLEADEDGNLLTDIALSVSGITNDVYSTPVEFEGTVHPEPQLQITLEDVGDLTGFDVTNRLNGQQMTITPTDPVDGDVFIIDNENLTVTRNGLPQDFDGVWPDFELGDDNIIDINTYASSGTLLGASNTTNITRRILYGTRKEGQSFNLEGDVFINRVNLLLSKSGNPTNPVTLRIETDNAGSPSGTLLHADATIDIAASAVADVPSWIQNLLTFIPALDNVTYWLVLSTTGGDVNNCYNWHMSNTNTYAGGVAKENNGTWVQLSGDFNFKVFDVTVDLNNSQIDFDSATLNYSATTQKNGATTAKWVGDGVVAMNGVLNQPTDVFSGTGFDWSTSGCRFCDAVFWRFVCPGPVGATVKLKTVTVRVKKGFDTGTLGLSLRSSAQGSNFASATTAPDVANATYQDYTVTFNTNLVGGTAYWCGGGEYGVGETIFAGVQGTVSNVDNSSAKVAMMTDWSRQTPSFSGNWIYSGTAGVHHTMTFEYTDYSATEYAITNALDATDADILAASQYVTTSLLGGSTFQGAFSPDGGTTWINLPRDVSLMATDTLATVTGQDFRWRGGLAGPNGTPGFIFSTQVAFRKGIILDATTKRAAQQLQVDSNGGRQRLDLYLAKMGAPGDITVRVESDNGSGSPSGNLVHANATKTLTAASVAANFGWVAFNFPGAFTLNMSTNYHVVVSAAGTVNNANKYLIMANNNRLSGGTAEKSTNSGSTYSDLATGEDLMVRTYETSGEVFRYNLEVTYVKRYA